MPDTNTHPHVEPDPTSGTSDGNGFHIEDTPINSGNGHEDPGVEWPDGYYSNHSGVWFQPEPKNPGDPLPKSIWICRPLDIMAETNDVGHRSHGLWLSWRDPTGFQHMWSMPRRMVHAQNGGSAIAAELTDAGLTCAATKQAHELLRMLLAMVQVKRRVRCVESAGWHASTYVLPDGRTFGPNDAEVVLQSENSVATSQSYEGRGTLEEWQAQIARYAVGNDLLALSISMGFAAPLLSITGDESGGLHIYGHSRSGKTTVVRCAVSIYGPGDKTGPMRTWRATSNGLEGVAAASNDGLLVLDEMGEASAREVGDTVYMLANEGGKSRANRTGGARRRHVWRLLFLSSGEITLAAKMGEAGRAMHAGQDMRLIGISADAGAGLGVWNKLHDKPSPAVLSEHLRAASLIYCGTAGPAFLEKLAKDRVDDPTQLTETIRQLQERFLSQVLPKGADGQVRSAAWRFALIAAAGELATAYGVTGWPVGEALRAAQACFNRWLSERGHKGPAEDTQAVEAVRAFIGSYGMSRFEDAADQEQRPVNNRAGFRRRDDKGGWEYLILPSAWKAEVCKGLVPSHVAAVLADRELLLGWSKKQPATLVKVPGYPDPMRLYRVSGAILEGADDPNDGGAAS